MEPEAQWTWTKWTGRRPPKAHRLRVPWVYHESQQIKQSVRIVGRRVTQLIQLGREGVVCAAIVENRGAASKGKSLTRRKYQQGYIFQKGRKRTDAWLAKEPAYVQFWRDVSGEAEPKKEKVCLDRIHCAVQPGVTQGEVVKHCLAETSTLETAEQVVSGGFLVISTKIWPPGAIQAFKPASARTSSCFGTYASIEPQRIRS